MMKLAICETKARLTDLVRRAEAGEDVVLTRHGHAVARLVALHAKPSGVHRANLIAANPVDKQQPHGAGLLCQKKRVPEVIEPLEHGNDRAVV